MKKYIGHIIITFLVLLIIFVPQKISEVIKPTIKDYDLESEIAVTVNMSGSNEVRELTLEEYIVGVVASEMPVSFEMEALKAQAVAARTYTYFKILDGSQAEMTNTQLHQVYKDLDVLKGLWDEEYTRNINKIRKAVYDTKGEVITHSQSVINATYFSTSNGLTENSEDMWNYEIPYLRSVESSWDIVISPKYKNEKHLSVEVFNKALGLQGDINIQKYNRTSTNRVETVVINNKTFDGNDIRRTFELESTDFEIVINDEGVLIESKGFGHGVGMSQYGAQGMALEGYGYQDIINHYYKDVKIEKLLN